MKFDAISFDLDGTLIDSARGLHRAVAASMRDLGRAEPDLATVTGFVGNGSAILMRRAVAWADGSGQADAVDDALAERALKRFLHHYAEDPVTGTEILPGAREVLRDLAARGVALGLCTNKTEAPTRTILDAFDLGPFAAIACGDTLPERKPDPAPLLWLIDRLGTVPGRALHVGDSIVDWQTAQAAGVAYLHVAGGYQAEPIPDFAPFGEIAGLGDLIATVAAATSGV